MISGYRELSEKEIAIINKIKDLEIACISAIEGFQGDSYGDQRWLAIAKTDIEKGFMSFVKAIAQPRKS